MVNNLIGAHYNIIVKTAVASDGKLPSSLVGHQMSFLVQWFGVVIGGELTPLVQWFGVVIVVN